MTTPMINRRNVIQRVAQMGALTLAAGSARQSSSWAQSETIGADTDDQATTWNACLTPIEAIRFCLNTSTIRQQKLSLAEEVDLCSQLHYDGIEPWIRELHAYQQAGGSLPALKRRIEDAGLTVDSAIGFASWIVDDPQQRARGLETMKRDMLLLREIGGTRIAAPPVGATQQADLDLAKAAERFAALVELGREVGVQPQLEVWGFSQTMSRLGELMYVASEAGDTDVLLLPDVYHLFKGGSDFRGLAMVAGSAIEVMHLNDYPGEISREQIGDKHRVYPGDGVAPLPQIIRLLRANGFRGTFSLELFNPDYWRQPATEVARIGLQKMKAAVEASDQVGDDWPAAS